MSWQLHLLGELSSNDALFPLQFDRRQIITLHQTHDDMLHQTHDTMRAACTLSPPCSSPSRNTNTPHPLFGQQLNMSHADVKAFSPRWPQVSAPHTPISRMYQMRDETRAPTTPRAQPRSSNLLHSGTRLADAQDHRSLTHFSEERAGRLAGVGLRLSEDVPHTGRHPEEWAQNSKLSSLRHSSFS